MGSKRQGDEAAVLVVENRLAIISCVHFPDADPEKNLYLPWVSRQMYKYRATVHWYAVEEREGRHTARVQVFRRFPEAQAAIVKTALEQASDQKPWLRTFANFGVQKPMPVLV